MFSMSLSRSTTFLTLSLSSRKAIRCVSVFSRPNLLENMLYLLQMYTCCAVQSVHDTSFPWLGWQLARHVSFSIHGRKDKWQTTSWAFQMQSSILRSPAIRFRRKIAICVMTVISRNACWRELTTSYSLLSKWTLWRLNLCKTVLHAAQTSFHFTFDMRMVSLFCADNYCDDPVHLPSSDNIWVLLKACEILFL